MIYENSRCGGGDVDNDGDDYDGDDNEDEDDYYDGDDDNEDDDHDDSVPNGFSASMKSGSWS